MEFGQASRAERQDKAWSNSERPKSWVTDDEILEGVCYNETDTHRHPEPGRILEKDLPSSANT